MRTLKIQMVSMKNRVILFTSMLLFFGLHVQAGQMSESFFEEIKRTSRELQMYSDQSCSVGKAKTLCVDAYVAGKKIQCNWLLLQQLRTERQLEQLVQELKAYEAIFGAKVEKYGLSKQDLTKNLQI